MNSEKINEHVEMLYKTKIEQNIPPLEETRIKIQKLSNIIMLWTILLIVVIAVACYFFQEEQYFLHVIIACILMIIILMRNISLKENKYRNDLKNKLLMPIFSIFGNFYYSNKPAILLREINNYGLFHKASYKKDDDVIIGKYKDINISITETELYHTRPSEHGSSRSSDEKAIDFSGLILKIEMNKNFEGHTVVRQKPINYEQFMNNFKAFQSENSELFPPEILNILNSPIAKFIFDAMSNVARSGISLSQVGSLSIEFTLNNTNLRSLEEVKLEDVEFNNMFEIFSDNQIEARYLLTPSFMERLKRISMIMLVLNVHCVFNDGCIILFLNHPINVDNKSDRGFFELEPCKKGETLYNKEIYKRVLIELLTIFDFINHFKLDQKIGM